MSTDSDRLLYDALTRQLERMRAMQYAYHRKFFTLLLASSAAMLVALWNGSPTALVLLLFGLVTTGVGAAFLLHFCDFARVHAAALEGRLNRILGGRVLIAAELEAEYFYPPCEPKLAGLSLAAPGTFFSFFTLHFCLVWAGASVYALWYLVRFLGESHGWVLPAYLGWLAVNGVFVGNWFLNGRAERRMAAVLREAHGAGPGPGSGDGKAPAGAGA